VWSVQEIPVVLPIADASISDESATMTSHLNQLSAFCDSTTLASCTDWLHVEMMRSVIAEIMIVFVPAFAFAPQTAAINARQCIRVGPTSSSDFNVDSLASLHFIAVACWHRRRAWTTRQRIHTERHNHPNV
jgi:hypothetical protein